MDCRKKLIETIFLSVIDYGDIIYRHAAATSLTSLRGGTNTFSLKLLPDVLPPVGLDSKISANLLS